jgi:hypothetical protein
MISIRDARSGDLRARFVAPDHIAGDPRLSRDGSRLVVWQTQNPPWYVLDTATGRLVMTIPADGRRTWDGHLDVIFDLDTLRGYHLRLPDVQWSQIPRETRPRPAWLIAYDLVTGAEVGRLELPMVHGGRWRTEQVGPRGEPLPAELSPTAVLSPDGTRLAVVHADRDGITLVDTEEFAVERTLQLTRSPDLPAPTPIMQPVGEPLAGLWRRPRAVFAPDGRHLYLYGEEYRTDNHGVGRERALPLRRVDLARGEITAEAAPDPRLQRVLPAPDGQSVYTASLQSESGDAATSRTWLRRLDAATLADLAEREFEGFVRPLLPPLGDVDLH